MKEKIEKEKKVKVRKKLSSKAKKIIILSCFCLLLLVTGGVNIFINNLASKEASANVQATAASFFTQYRTNRESTRSQELLYLESILSSDATSAEAKANAEAEIQRLAEAMNLVLKLETLIKAKGFNDVVVSTSAKTVNIMVETAGLNKTEVAQIVDIVLNNSDYNIDSIKISEV